MLNEFELTLRLELRSWETQTSLISALLPVAKVWLFWPPAARLDWFSVVLKKKKNHFSKLRGSCFVALIYGGICQNGRQLHRKFAAVNYLLRWIEAVLFLHDGREFIGRGHLVRHHTPSEEKKNTHTQQKMNFIIRKSDRRRPDLLFWDGLLIKKYWKKSIKGPQLFLVWFWFFFTLKLLLKVALIKTCQNSALYWNIKLLIKKIKLLQ